MTPKRIVRRRTAGWRLPENAVCVCRPSRFGNPFKMSQAVEWFNANEDDARQECVDKFRDWLAKGEMSEHWSIETSERWQWITDNLIRLKGKDLACYCPDGAVCHGDVLIELANRDDEQ